MGQAMLGAFAAMAAILQMFATEARAEIWSQMLDETPSWTFVGKFCWEDTPVSSTKKSRIRYNLSL